MLLLGMWWGKAEKCCLLEATPETPIRSHCSFQSQG